MKTCEACKYFFYQESKFGECRRHPPTITSDGYEFPISITKKWCGEWAERDDSFSRAKAIFEEVKP